MLKRFSPLVIILSLIVFMATGASAQIRDHSALSKKAKTADDDKPSGQNGLKSFTSLIKDKLVVEGLFTFYRDTVDNSLLMAISSDQLGPYFLRSQESAHRHHQGPREATRDRDR